MLKIQHRVNDSEALARVDPALGVEMDVRAFGEEVVVQHDPFRTGTNLGTWLDAYHHAFVILNIKEEGIERRVRDAVLSRGIQNFFLLDLSFPALLKLANAGERRIAVRVSEYEPVAGALALADRLDWVWIDVFRGFPLSDADYAALRAAGLRLCLVSPELHGRAKNKIGEMRDLLARRGVTVDAVCTKHPELW